MIYVTPIIDWGALRKLGRPACCYWHIILLSKTATEDHGIIFLAEVSDHHQSPLGAENKVVRKLPEITVFVCLEYKPRNFGDLIA